MNGKKHGYGYQIDGEYKYGYSIRERAYSYMRRNKEFAKCTCWAVFKIDALGYHEIQRHYKQLAWYGREETRAIHERNGKPEFKPKQKELF